MLTVIGLTVASLIGGAIVTETVFGLPGVGNLIVSAVLRRDYPVIEGALLVISGIYVLINLPIDMIYLASIRACGPADARAGSSSAASRCSVSLVLAIVLATAILAPWVAPYGPQPHGHRPPPRPALRRAPARHRRFRPRRAVPRHLRRPPLGHHRRPGRRRLHRGGRRYLGLLAGYVRRLDEVLSRFTDALMAFPDILLAIALMAALGPSLIDVVAALGTVYTPRVARLVRGVTLVLSRLQFIEAAVAIGAGDARIIRRHLLPNLLSPLLVQATFIFASAVLTEAALSFLGAGIPPTTPSWGNMIAGAQQYMDRAEWLILAPGLAILLTVLSLQILGDALRDALDPRLRRLT